ncbi:hypothetical protein ACLMJK_007590 [Lecanora helva]
MASLAALNGPLSQLKTTLERLIAKVKPVQGLKKAGRALIWPLKKSEVQEILGSLERQKSLLILALQNESQLLSQRIKSDVSDVKATMQNLERLSMDEFSSKLLDWLSPPAPQRKHSNIRNRRLQGSGHWLLEQARFKVWLQDWNQPRLLWCPGKPGAGKTVLASLVIDTITERFAHTSDLAYFYYDYSDQEAQNPVNVVGSLLRQFLSQRAEISSEIQDLYDRSSRTGQSPQLEDILPALMTLCQDHRQRFIVVDALDEGSAGQSRQIMLDLVQKMDGLPIRFFITSRPHADWIKRALESFPQVTIEAHESDIAQYITRQIEASQDLADIIDTGLKENIISELCASANGMFLLPALQIQNIIHQPTKTKIRQALKDKPSELDVAFKDTIKRIENQPIGRAQLAMRALLWVSHAYRPLSKAELCEALAFQPGDTRLDKDDVPVAKHLIDYCCGLIILDDQGDLCRLMHHSLREFLLTNQEGVFSSGQQYITSTCLTYLAFDDVRYLGSQLLEYRIRDKFTSSRTWSRVFDNGEYRDRVLTMDEAVKRLLSDPLECFPLLQYAVLDWPRHANNASSSTYATLALKMLQDDNSRRSYIALFNMFYKPLALSVRLSFVSRLDIDSSPTHLTAFFGFRDLTETLLKDGDASIDAEDEFGNTPLSMAALNNHLDVVKTLLNKPSMDATRASRPGVWSHLETALYAAAMNHHIAMVALLIEHGADVNAANALGDTPLMLASRGGSMATINILLDAGASVNATDKFGRNVLDYVIMWEVERAEHLLRERGAVPTENFADTAHQEVNVNRLSATPVPTIKLERT